MKIIVCIKQLADGEINPFDASALETALALEPEKITVVSMGPEKAKALLEGLTRLGPVEAVLLSDKTFAGADTLATSLTLSAWLSEQEYDLILCGRQSIDGETAQVGPELAQLLGLDICTRVMEIKNPEKRDGTLVCTTREGEQCVTLPALLTMERTAVLRFPSLWAQKKTIAVVNREMLGLKQEVCGLAGSPTRVLKSWENEGGRRNCRMITPGELPEVFERALRESREGFRESDKAAYDTKRCENTDCIDNEGEKLPEVWITDEILRTDAEKIAEKVTLQQVDMVESFCDRVRECEPEVILFPADWTSRNLAPRIAAALRTGLCADCTALLVEDGELHMVRPALGGNLTAKIRCSTRPVMATVRSAAESAEEIIFAVGRGAVKQKKELTDLAEKYHGSLAASRACVELGEFPYEYQVGLTGKTVAPKLYLAFGISGAIHHIVGMERSGKVIAVNNDPEAPIFKYADFGVVCSAEEALEMFGNAWKSKK